MLPGCGFARGFRKGDLEVKNFLYPCSCTGSYFVWREVYALVKRLIHIVGETTLRDNMPVLAAVPCQPPIQSLKASEDRVSLVQHSGMRCNSRINTSSFSSRDRSKGRFGKIHKTLLNWVRETFRRNETALFPMASNIRIEMPLLVWQNVCTRNQS